MKAKLEAMGLDVVVENGGMLNVTGDSEKLIEARQMLNDNNFVDDTSVFSKMFGLDAATDFISRLMVCEFGEGNNGYCALA